MHKRYFRENSGADEKLLELAEKNRTGALMYPWVLASTDDWGRAEANPRGVNAKLFPTWGFTSTEIQQALSDMDSVGLIHLYEVEGKAYLFIDPEVFCKYKPPGKRTRHMPSTWRVIRKEIFERDGYTCQYCGERNCRLECDHIIPASRGGGHDPANLTTACRKCNQSKRAKTPDEWLGGIASGGQTAIHNH